MVLEQEEKGIHVPGKNTLSLTLPDLVVLSLLSEQPMHGYQLVSELEIRDVQDWAEISRPQVYYSLKKLNKLNMIRKVKDPLGSLGPDRTKFAVTSQGSKALEASLSKEEWATQRPAPPFLTWMALSTHLPKVALRSIFAKRRQFLNEQLAREKLTLKSFEGASGPMVVSGRLMVDLCIQMFELELKWIDHAEAERC